MHPYLEAKLYPDAPTCPRCGSYQREPELGPARIARGRRQAHGGKIGWRCLKCRHFAPMVLVRHNSL